MEKFKSFAGLIVIILVLTSCGETIRGAWRDTQRIGEGTRKVFVADY